MVIDQVRTLARACASALNAPPRSLILHGSATTDDFVPGVSDVDLLIVVDRPLDDAEVAALTDVVGAADPAPAAGIDLHVVTAGVASAPTAAPYLELHLGRYPGESLEVSRGVPHDPDLPAELSTARTGRALLGAAPADVIGPVDPAWLRRRAEHWLATWLTLLDDEEHAVFMVLTACRMWRYAEEGTHTTKTAAGRWALGRDPSLTAVRRALLRRAGDGAATIAEDDLRVVLQIARDGVARA